MSLELLLCRKSCWGCAQGFHLCRRCLCRRASICMERGTDYQAQGRSPRLVSIPAIWLTCALCYYQQKEANRHPSARRKVYSLGSEPEEVLHEYMPIGYDGENSAAYPRCQWTFRHLEACLFLRAEQVCRARARILRLT